MIGVIGVLPFGRRRGGGGTGSGRLFVVLLLLSPFRDEAMLLPEVDAYSIVSCGRMKGNRIGEETPPGVVIVASLVAEKLVRVAKVLMDSVGLRGKDKAERWEVGGKVGRGEMTAPWRVYIGDTERGSGETLSSTSARSAESGVDE